VIRLPYRIRQLCNNLTAGPLTEAERAEITEHLTVAERDLFFRFTYADQQHSYCVFHTLREAGYNHPDLLTAALLHDVGKIRQPLSVWDRTVIVIGSGLFPGQARNWGRGPLDSWRRPFVVRAQHPAWGAEMASEAGSRPRVVEMIRRHQERIVGNDEIDRLLIILQWADDQN